MEVGKIFLEFNKKYINTMILLYIITKGLLSSICIGITTKTRCTRSFFRNKNATCNSARMNKFDFTTEKIGSVHKTVFEIVAPRNIDNWIHLLT